MNRDEPDVSIRVVIFVIVALWTPFGVWFFLQDCPACWPPSLAYPQVYGIIIFDCLFILGGLLYAKVLVPTPQPVVVFLVGLVCLSWGLLVPGSSVCYAYYYRPSALTIFLWEVAIVSGMMLMGLGVVFAIPRRRTLSTS